jgi:hypothetical protein
LIAPPWPGRSMYEAEVAESHSERVRWAIERIQAQGAVAHVNHPNYLYTLTIDDLLASGDFGLLEVANGHNAVHNEGDPTHPSTEIIWDSLLGSGQRIWGVASDDAHHFQVWGENYSNPGRGWLQVEAESARLGDVLEALRDGRFYCSAGLELAGYEVSPSAVQLELRDATATMELIGPGGTVLETEEGDRASFKLTAAGAYARVRATSADGRQLWTQPVFR